MKNPMQLIAVIIAITIVLGSAYALLGRKMEAGEETYLPDNEIVKAQKEIRDLFGAEVEYVYVLVKSKNGDVVTKDALSEILNVEKGFLDDVDINSTLVPEKNIMRIIDAVDFLLIGKVILETIDVINETFYKINETFDFINILINTSLQLIDLALESGSYDGLNAGIQGVNISLYENISTVPQEFSLDMLNLERFTAIQAMSVDEKIENISRMNNSEIKAIIGNICSYKGDKTAYMCITAYNLENVLNNLYSNLERVNTTFNSLKEDENITNETKNAIESVQSIIQPLTFIHIQKTDIENTTKKLDSAVEFIGHSIALMLTKDFHNQIAEATVFALSFNASYLSGETREEREKRFLNIERRMECIIKSKNSTSTKMYVMGDEIISDEITTAANRSVEILLPIAFIFVLIILAVAYRSIFDTIISAIALGFIVIWVYGLGALLGFTFNPMTVVVPVLVVGLGIDYGIHTTLRYKEGIMKGSTPEDSAKVVIKSVGTALTLCLFTTVIAFASNLTSDMNVIREFGILCAFGVGSSFVIMLFFISSYKQIIDRWKLNKGKKLFVENKKAGKIKNAGIAMLDGCLGIGAITAERHPITVVCVVMLITGAAFTLGLNLSTEFNLKDFLPPELEVTQNIDYISNNFNLSAESASILIKGDVTNPNVLKAINSTTSKMENDIYVKKISGSPDVTTIISVMHDVASDDRIKNPLDLYNKSFEELYSESDTDGDGIPDTNISFLYDWLYENENASGRVKTVLHRNDFGEYDACVLRINVYTEDGKKAEMLYDELKEDCIPLNNLSEISQSVITGTPILVYVITTSLAHSMLASVIITLLVACIVLTFVFYYLKKSLILGVLATLPVLLANSWILGTMFLLGIPYNVLTITVSALTVGLGIDYSIHVTYRFLEEAKKTEDIEVACRATVLHTGTALFCSAITTIAGFGIMVFSLLPPLRVFGIIVALTILYSFIASIFVLPTFLTLWARGKMRKI